eukprot:14636767-Heterocapsa_arctica.AAC.1
MKGWTEKGSPKGKGNQQNWRDFGPSGKGYGYSEPAGKGYGDQGKGKTDWVAPMVQDVERKKLGNMRTAAAALENLEGSEEQLANLRLEIK